MTHQSHQEHGEMICRITSSSARREMVRVLAFGTGVLGLMITAMLFLVAVANRPVDRDTLLVAIASAVVSIICLFAGTRLGGAKHWDAAVFQQGLVLSRSLQSVYVDHREITSVRLLTAWVRARHYQWPYFELTVKAELASGPANFTMSGLLRSAEAPLTKFLQTVSPIVADRLESAARSPLELGDWRGRLKLSDRNLHATGPAGGVSGGGATRIPYERVAAISSSFRTVTIHAVPGNAATRVDPSELIGVVTLPRDSENFYPMMVIVARRAGLPIEPLLTIQEQ